MRIGTGQINTTASTNNAMAKTYKILAVDDEQGILDSLSIFLKRSGYAFTGITNPVEALERIKSEIDSLETEIQQVKAEQKKLQEKKRKLLDELKVDPAEKDLNEEDIKREEANLKVSNDKIQKLEEQKTETVRQLRENESYLENDDISSERKQQYEKQLQQLKEEQDAQKELIEQKKENLQAVITEQDELTRLEQELKKKQDLLKSPRLKHCQLPQCTQTHQPRF